MLQTVTIQPARSHVGATALQSAAPASDARADQRASQHIADTLKLLCERVSLRRRVVHAGDVIYQAGERFDTLYVLNSGFFKMVNLSADGREQVVGLKFRGDWLGFDGIASGALLVRRGGDGHRRGLGDPLRRAAVRLRRAARRC